MMIAILFLVLVVAAVSVTAAHRAAERARCSGRIIRVNLVPCLAYCLVAILVLGMLS